MTQNSKPNAVPQSIWDKATPKEKAWLLAHERGHEEARNHWMLRSVMARPFGAPESK